MNKKYVDKLHLNYTIIIFVILIVSFLTFYYGNSEGASTTLNNFATSTSIVLAIVAIIMTIVDIAGQRGNIIDLKATSESFNKNLADIEKRVVELNDLKSSLLSSMNEVNEISRGLETKWSEFTDKMKEKGFTGDDADKFYENFRNELARLSKINNSNQKPINEDLARERYIWYSNKIEKYIFSLEINKRFDKNKILKKIEINYPDAYIYFDDVLMKMENNGNIKMDGNSLTLELPF